METELGRIPSHWEVGSFEEDLKIQGRIGWKGYKTSDLVPIGPYVIGGGEIKSNIFLQLEHAQRISREKYNESPEIMLKEGDVLLVTRGNLGEVGYYHGIYGEGTINPSVIILNNFNGDSKFLFYYLISKQGKANVLSLSSGSSVPAIYQADVYTLKYPKPPIDEQTKISKIAFSIDLKIDLLHRQNATLEKLAETLFRQWFVEEAKEEWETKPLSSIAYFLNGLACQKYPPKNDLEKLPVIKIKELSSGITENSDWATTDVKPEYIVKNGDVIFAWSASLMVKIWDGQDCILNQHLFKVTSENYPKWFYFLWCKHYLDEFIAKAASHATTMGHIKRGDLDDAMVLIPSTKELEEMTFETEPLIAKIISNNRQLRLLVNLRDTLLPKLMSGEIRVKIN